MAREPVPTTTTIEDLFPRGQDAARAVLLVLERNPRRVWTAEQLIETTQLRPIEVLLIVARLTNAGILEHPALGAYRYNSPAARADAAG